MQSAPGPPSPPEDVSLLVRSRDQERIAAMFNAIARRYDLMNRLMTAGQDRRWRRLAASAARLKPGDRALDVAAGTGDMARELAAKVMPGGEVVAVDIASEMLDIGRRKLRGLPVRFEYADAMDLPYDSVFDAATVAFGFRNFPDRRLGLSEMARSLKPGGRLVILELTPSVHPLGPIIDAYTHRVIPLLGRFISGQGGAYAYLPRSMDATLTVSQIAELMREVGLHEVGERRLNFDTVAICWGRKAANGPAPRA